LGVGFLFLILALGSLSLSLLFLDIYIRLTIRWYSKAHRNQAHKKGHNVLVLQILLRRRLLSRGEMVAASKLIVSRFQRFGLTIQTGSKRKKRRLENGGHLAAALEDIEIDEDPFISFCFKFKYLGSYFVPELNDTVDITKRISQTRRLVGSMNKQLLSSSKQIPIDIRRRLYQPIVVNIAFHFECLRRMCGWKMWHVAKKQITNEHIRGTVASSSARDSMMPMALQPQRNEGVKISEANAQRMVSNAKTSRETSADHAIRVGF
jgi:hypothetical protein